MQLTRTPYGTTGDGQAVDEFFVENSNGVSFKLITYGATLTSVKTPDSAGNIGEITLGFDSLEGYEGPHPFFGATVGRFANRIAGGRFVLDDTEYQLEKNNKGKHHIHGGSKGFNRRVWEAYPVKQHDAAGVTLTLTSEHMDQGYPGTLDVKLTVMLSEENELSFSYDAAADRATPVNLTNHTYWNLSGECSGTVLDHVLYLNSERFVEVDSELIPTGHIAPVKDSPFDFRTPKPIGKNIEAAGGYDHCFTLSEENALSIPAARVTDPASGRVMTVFTISPGIQFYSGNFLQDMETRCGKVGPHAALCLETEEYPDAVNHPEFPDAVLSPKDRYLRKSVYQFSTRSTL